MKNLIKIAPYILLISFFFNSAHAGKIEIYKVKSIAKGSVLIVYKDPTVHSAKIAKIPAKAKWIIKKSPKRLYGKQYWRKITWNKRTGWVKANELRIDPKATRNAKKDKRCLKPNGRPKSCNK